MRSLAELARGFGMTGEVWRGSSYGVDRPYDAGDELSQLRWALASGDSYGRIGLHLWQSLDPDLLMVYVEATDSVSHLFGHLFRADGLAGELAEQQLRFGRTVEEVYAWADELVGRYLAALDERTTLVVLSDHGFALGTLPDDPTVTRSMRRVSERFHREHGVIALCGRGVPDATPAASAVDPQILAHLRALGYLDKRAGSPDGARNLAALDFQAGRYAEAVAAYEELVRANPVDAGLRASLAGALGALGRFEEAGHAAEEAIRLDPLSFEAYHNRAVLLERQGRREEAVASYRTALRCRPDYEPSREALRRLTGSAEVDPPRDASERQALGLAEQARQASLRGDYRGAMRLLDEAERLAPGYVVVYQYRSNVAYFAGDLDTAAAALERALALDPGNALYRVNLERLRPRERGVGELQGMGQLVRCHGRHRHRLLQRHREPPLRRAVGARRPCVRRSCARSGRPIGRLKTALALAEGWEAPSALIPTAPPLTARSPAGSLGAVVMQIQEPARSWCAADLTRPEGGGEMAQRAFLLCWVVVLACVGVTWAETPVTIGPVSSGTVSVAPANVEPVAAPVRAVVRAVVRDAEGRFVKPPVLDRSAAPSRGPLVGFEVDPATGEVALMAPAEVNGPAKAIISGSFALDSVTCTNCGGCPALGDRTLAVVLEATQYVAAESYGVSDLVSSNYTATGVVHTVPELNPGDLLSITISGDIGVCDTFRVFFDMCDTPPQDPTGACVGGPTSCVDNPQWMPVDCTTPDWVWSSNLSYLTLAAANAAHTLWVGDQHFDVPNTCSLDGTGWVSTTVFTMLGCDTDWYHIGGWYTGPCGGHDGDQVRRLAMGANDCYPY